MKPLVSFRQAIADPQLLGNALTGDSWHAWRVLLLASLGEPLTEAESITFQELTGRVVSPNAPCEEFVGIIGRRGGKSRAVSVVATYAAGLCSHEDTLAPGERGIVLCIAPDQRQSRVCLDYIEGAFRSSPVLSGLIAERIADALRLTNGIEIEVRAASFRRLRGVTTVCVLADEAAYWPAEGSVNPDTEILTAIRPTLATTRGPLFIISSPYAKRGELYELYSRHYGPNGDPLILVAKGTSRALNPSLPEHIVQRALERDYAAASAEYLAEFRADIEGFVSIEVVRSCIDSGVRERPYNPRFRYFGFTDPAGGSGADSMTLAIGHVEGRAVVLDVIREIRPPFSPDAATEELSRVLSSYRISTTHGDRYGGTWPAERFSTYKIAYRPAALARSELYQELLPRLNAGTIRLLDDDRLVSQLVGLERRHGRNRDVIDHPPNAHDDVANAVAGVASVATARKAPVAQMGTYVVKRYAPRRSEKVLKTFRRLTSTRRQAI